MFSDFGYHVTFVTEATGTSPIAQHDAPTGQTAAPPASQTVVIAGSSSRATHRVAGSGRWFRASTGVARTVDPGIGPGLAVTGM